MQKLKDIFPCGLNVREFWSLTPWSGISSDDLFEVLGNKFSRNFNGDTKLRPREFEFLCKTYFGDEDEFYQDCYGKHLTWKKRKIQMDLDKHLDYLKTIYKNLLLKYIDEKTDLFKPIFLDSKQLLPFFEVSFNHNHYSKPGEESMASVYYAISLKGLNFKKELFSDYDLTGVYDKYLVFADNEEFYKKNIPQIKLELIAGLDLIKKRKLIHLDWDIHFTSAFNRESYNLNTEIIIEQAYDIIEINKELEYFEFEYSLNPNDNLDSEYNIKYSRDIPRETAEILNLDNFTELQN